jgi:mono/diheme cytochrome c family protein
MMRAASRIVLLCFALTLAPACDSLPGKPKPSDQPLMPQEVKDFARLYGDNCAGCHGVGGAFGAATQLNNPVYQALVDDASLHRAIAQGVPGTSMPPFAISEGGALTNDQIASLTSEMRRLWARPGILGAAAAVPPYAARTPGSAQQGAKVYSTFCESCHGPDGKDGPKAGSIVDGSYLSLTSNQSLRTLIICGRPDFGHPDWRSYLAGRRLSAQQVSDLVAWLAAQRPQISATPYAQNQ